MTSPHWREIAESLYLEIWGVLPEDGPAYDSNLLKIRSALADASRHGAREALEKKPPLFWQHAIAECNEAHQALDQLHAPKTRMVRRIRGEGDQAISLGLKDRILSIPKLL